MTRTELIEAVRTLNERLSNPLPAEERAAGWTEAKRVDMLRYFQNLERDLQNGVDIPFFSLVRALDGMGITEGKLLEEACRINNAVNGLKR